jgi:hypothetical protein
MNDGLASLEWPLNAPVLPLPHRHPFCRHLGVWRLDGGIERPWDFRAARRAIPSEPSQRPVTLTIINDPKPPAEPPQAAAFSRRWRCREVGSWERAQQLLREGHTYLDGDGDGEACKRLR